MKKEYTYVTCDNCKDWKEEYINQAGRLPCRRCNDTHQVINPKEILCNLCGECMCPDYENEQGTWYSQEPHGLYEASVTGGYESYHLFDMNKYTFSFCELCLRKLFVLCKIKPKVEDVNLGTGETTEIDWEDDQIPYEYRIWEGNGGAHQAYLNKMCNAVKECPNRALYTVKLSDEFTEHCCCEEHQSRWDNTINAELVKFISNVFKPFL